VNLVGRRAVGAVLVCWGIIEGARGSPTLLVESGEEGRQGVSDINKLDMGNT